MAPLTASAAVWLGWALVWWAASLKSEKTQRAESFWQRQQHLLPSALAVWLMFSPTLSSLLRPLWGAAVAWGGVALTAAGFGFAIWARRHIGRYWSGIITLKEGHRLIRTGPYARVRHPIYTGLLIAALGTAFSGARWTGFVGVAVLVAAYRRKAAREEALLREKFGAEYDDYARTAGLLLPRRR